MLGNIRFIGHLYKTKMLTEKIMHECVIKLLGDVKSPDLDEIECLCQAAQGDWQDDRPPAAKRMDEWPWAHQSALAQHGAAQPRRLMLQEVIELRRGNWNVRKPDPVQVVAVVAAARRLGGGASSDRIRAGQGDVRNEMGGGRGGRRPAAARRFIGTAGRGGGRGSRGSSRGGGARSPLEGRFASQGRRRRRRRRRRVQPRRHRRLTEEQVGNRVDGSIDEYLEGGDAKELVACIREIVPRLAGHLLGLKGVETAIGKGIEARTGRRATASPPCAPLHAAKLLSSAELETYFKDACGSRGRGRRRAAHRLYYPTIGTRSRRRATAWLRRRRLRALPGRSSPRPTRPSAATGSAFMAAACCRSSSRSRARTAPRPSMPTRGRSRASTSSSAAG